jgi:hypothetical protein
VAKAKPQEDPLVAKAFAEGPGDELVKAVAQLSPEEAEFFLRKLEAALRKRKIMLSGYIVAMVAWLVGMVCAIAYFGISTGFVGWVFLVPFGIVGGILWVFGKWANHVGAAGVTVSTGPAPGRSSDAPSPQPDAQK